jgi:very-short-patch-repair endonuclease
MQGQNGSRWAWLAKLARNQHGAVAYGQVIEIGFTPGAIEHAVRLARLHRVYRGVYAVGHPRLSRDGQLMAAVLACGPDAVVSHWSAAEHWGLLKTRRSLIAISVAGHRSGHKGVRVHRLRALPPNERTRRDRIPITTVPRTLLDLAATGNTKQLQRAVNEAERRDLLKERAIRETLERHRGRAGVKALRAVIAGVNPQSRRSRSDLEIAFLQLCRRYGLPTPEVNPEVEGYEVDMHWPGTKLIVELDTWDYHGTTIAFESDRRRDADLASKGYTVIRVTGAWMDADPANVAATIAKLLTT